MTRHDRRHGFTLIEVLVVIMIGAVLLTITVNSLGGVWSRMAVREAREILAAVHARTRAQAIEFGANTILNLDTQGDSIWISRNDTTLEVIRLTDELDVDLIGSQASYELCFNPRGYGQPSCSNFTSTATLSFIAASDSAEVKLYPFGQLTY